MKKLLIVLGAVALLGCGGHVPSPYTTPEIHMFVENNTHYDLIMYIDKTWVDNLRRNEVMEVTIYDRSVTNSELIFYDADAVGYGFVEVSRSRPRNFHHSPCWRVYLDEGGIYGEYVAIKIVDEQDRCL